MKFSKLHLIFLSLTASMAFLLTGCDKIAGSKTSRSKTTSASKSSAKPSATQAEDDDEEESSGSSDAENHAITFHNNLLGFMRASQQTFKDLSKAMEDSDDYAKYQSHAPDWRMVGIHTGDFKKVPGYKFAAPSSFPQEDKAFFNTRIQTVQESCAEILQLIDSMQSYYRAEDYKDDWHKKALMTCVRIENLMETIGEANSEMFSRSDEITEEIDRRNLAQNPIGVYVLNMRFMLDKAKEQSNLLLTPSLKDTRYGTGVASDERASMIANAKPIVERVEALFGEMDEMAAKYKAADRTALKKHPKGSSLEKEYDGFFSSYEENKATLRRILRDLKDNGYFNDQHNVKDYTSSLMRRHNGFIDVINGK